MSIVARAKFPLEASFGPEIGKHVLKLFTDNDVKMIMNSGIKSVIVGDEQVMTHIELIDGNKIPCDILVLGAGVQMNTKFLLDSGININENGSIDTDEYLRSGNKDVYIGGDIANAPVLCNDEQRAQICHYQLAQYHGRMAAINMVASQKGKKLQKISSVPFFFTMLFGKGLRYAGYGPYKDVVIDGDIENFTFAAYFINENNRVVAVASCSRDPIVAQFAEFLSQGLTLTREDLKEDMNSWTKNIKT